MLALVGGWCHQASPSLCPRWAMEIWPGHIIQHYPPTMACVSQYGLIWPRHAIWQSQAAFYRNLIICPHVEDILSQLASSLSAVHVNVEWICIINTHLRLPLNDDTVLSDAHTRWCHLMRVCFVVAGDGHGDLGPGPGLVCGASHGAESIKCPIVTILGRFMITRAHVDI